MSEGLDANLNTLENADYQVPLTFPVEGLTNQIMNVAFMDEKNSLRIISASSERALKTLHPELTEDSYVVLTDEFKKTLDKDYFFAYEFDENKNFVMNLDKAKEIKKNALRIERLPELAKLDVAFVRALEEDNLEEKAKIMERKRYLRDIPELVDVAVSLDEVKSISIEPPK